MGTTPDELLDVLRERAGEAERQYKHAMDEVQRLMRIAPGSPDLERARQLQATKIKAYIKALKAFNAYLLSRS
jgi:hypothetical protein